MKIIQLSLLIFFSIRCVPDNDLGGLQTEVNIIVTDEFTDEELSGEEFEFIKCSSNFSFEYNCGHINGIFSDSTGSVNYIFTNEVDHYYLMKYRPHNAWQYPKYMSPIYYRIKEGEINYINWELRPTSVLGINFKHEPISGYERMQCNVDRLINENRADYRGFQVSPPFRNLDQRIDTTIFHSVMQEEKYIIKAYLSKIGGGGDHVEKTVNIERQDTILVEYVF